MAIKGMFGIEDFHRNYIKQNFWNVPLVVHGVAFGHLIEVVMPL